MRTVGTLLTQLKGLNHVGGGKKRLRNDVQSGRAYALLALAECDKAVAAVVSHEPDTQGQWLPNPDLAAAVSHLVRAQEHYITALRRQVKDHERLLQRPDGGGRPDNNALALRLFERPDQEPHTTIIARCRAAIRKDEILLWAYNDRTNRTVNEAYRQGEKMSGKP